MWEEQRRKGRIAYGIEAAALSGEIAELAPQTRRVVLDLSGVVMIDAAGLGELVSVALAAQASGCSVTPAAPGDFIRHLLELTKLTSVVEVYPTLEAAGRRKPWTSGMTVLTRFTALGSSLKPTSSSGRSAYLLSFWRAAIAAILLEKRRPQNVTPAPATACSTRVNFA